jgi:hypothetical protein
MPLEQTPQAAVSWQASGDLSAYAGFPGDPQISVSTTHVVVTARAVIAFYEKSGNLIRVITAADFFRGLNLDSQFGIQYYYDLRTIFDPFRMRFWIILYMIYNDE